MKVTCLQENLIRGLQIAGRGVSTRTTLPILSNVLVSVNGGEMKLVATDLEIGIEASFPADVKQAVLLECARVFRRKYTPDGLLAETTAGVAGYAVRVPTELDRTTQTLLAPYRVHVMVA